METATDQPFRHLGQQVNKIMEQMHRGYYNFRPGDTWSPNVNVYETDDSYVVCVDLAGVDKDKIDLEIADHRLTLRGHREVPSCALPEGAEPKRVKVHVMEIDHGPFHRQVDLPANVHREKITATHRNGFLWIEIPKQ